MINETSNDMVSVCRSDLENLIYYADACAGILTHNGYSGKAEALTVRFMKLADQIGLKPDCQPIAR
jgi:hypothetical protein